MNSSFRSAAGGHSSRLATLVCALAFAAGARGQTPEAPRYPLAALSESLAALSEQVSPAVVEVIASGFTAVSAQNLQETGEITVGTVYESGVFIDSAGYILTSARLVAGAEQIRVLAMLPAEGGRSVRGSAVRPVGRLLDAEVLGYDLETDVAVLKAGVRTLRYLRLADSDTLHKGQLVFAFGNPRGAAEAVSMGVVSAAARQPAPEDPMIYIQTDAAIGSHGAGGPLVNVRGEMIGLNTLRGRKGASGSYSYAVPSNIVRTVYEQIREHGRVRRGTIGVLAQTITPEMAVALKLPVSQGVIIGDVLPMSPADQARIEIGDIVLSLDGKRMENGRQLIVNLYQRRQGDTVTLTTQRGEEVRPVEVRVIERDEAPQRLSKLVDPKKSFVPQLGVLAVDVNQDILDEIPFLRTLDGVLVAALPAGLPRAYDFRPGDVVHSVNGVQVRNLAELREQLEGKGRGDFVVLQLERLGQLQYCTVELVLDGRR